MIIESDSYSFSAWVSVARCYLKPRQRYIVDDAHQFADRLCTLGLNLATAGALCAAEQIGADPPVKRRVIATTSSGIECAVHDGWQAGCGWPVTAPYSGWEP